MSFVDLSIPLTEQTPVYPGDPRPRIEPAAVLEKDGYEDHIVSFGTHVGTHIDAPAHMLKGGKMLDQFPIERLLGRGVYIRVPKTFRIYALPLNLQIDGSPVRVVAEIIE